MKKGINRDTVAWLNQSVDFSPSGILRYLKEKGEKALIDNHRLPANLYCVLSFRFSFHISVFSVL